MLIRLTVTIGLYAIVLAANGTDLQSASGKEKAVYAVLLAMSVYLAFLFVLEKPWPNLDTVLHSIYAGPARAIAKMFKSA